MITMIAAAAMAAAQPAPAPAPDMHAGHSKHAEMKSGAMGDCCCCKDMDAKKGASTEATKPAA